MPDAIHDASRQGAVQLPGRVRPARPAAARQHQHRRWLRRRPGVLRVGRIPGRGTQQRPAGRCPQPWWADRRLPLLGRRVPGGQVIRIMQYEVATQTGFILYSALASAAVASAIEQMARAATLPAPRPRPSGCSTMDTCAVCGRCLVDTTSGSIGRCLRSGAGSRTLLPRRTPISCLPRPWWVPGRTSQPDAWSRSSGWPPGHSVLCAELTGPG